ncbi:MAG: hypothetical protein MHPSP_002457, partial [Paramarteilia canceri]
LTEYKKLTKIRIFKTNELDLTIPKDLKESNGDIELFVVKRTKAFDTLFFFFSKYSQGTQSAAGNTVKSKIYHSNQSNSNDRVGIVFGNLLLNASDEKSYKVPKSFKTIKRHKKVKKVLGNKNFKKKISKEYGFINDIFT